MYYKVLYANFDHTYLTQLYAHVQKLAHIATGTSPWYM